MRADAGGTPLGQRRALAVTVTLFFAWGFTTVWNDLLIPRFKDAFHLSYFQAMLVQFSFCAAYTLGSLAYYLISEFAGDPIARMGYRNGVGFGLLVAAAGSALFYPAALVASYPMFLAALFVLGTGFALLQIAANPYVTMLGPEPTAASRLNLAQGFNSVGTTIGPLVGGWLIFRVFARSGAADLGAVEVPYLGLAAVFVLLALGFFRLRLPSFAEAERTARSGSPLSHPHLVLGMGAIFMYVGGEVTVGSSIVSFLGSPVAGGLTREAASRYLAFYWGGLMIGRFMGAGMLSELSGRLKAALTVTTALGAFAVTWAAVGRAEAASFGAFIALLLVAIVAARSGPHLMLAVFGATNVALLALGATASGGAAKWAILAVGLFCSVMWSNIFSLALDGLGALKSRAASLLTMSVFGGAVLPPLQGALADRWGLQASLVVPMAAFAYVAFYGAYGYRAGRIVQKSIRLVQT